jgi:ubiquinone/menaquinone biosynthesis C-methylase UbiE
VLHCGVVPAWRILRALSRGVFPHEFAAFLELAPRRLLLSPGELLQRTEITAHQRVLEIGAGSGFYSTGIGSATPHLVMLDLQPEMLRKARSRHPDLQRVPCVAADASCLPFAKHTFDMIIMVTVFGEVKRSDLLLRETSRLLRADGLLSISEHLPDPDFTRSSQLRNLVEPHGFRLASRVGPAWSYTANFRKQEA